MHIIHMEQERRLESIRSNYICLSWKRTKCCLRKCSRCRSFCFKLFLVLVNLLFMTCGWAMVFLGIWIHLKQDAIFFSQILTDNPTNPIIVIEKIPFLLIGVGIVVAVTSFLGCCGACTESVCFLSFYAIFLSIMITTEIIFGITITSLKSQFSEDILMSMEYQIKYLYNKTALSPNTTTKDIIRLTASWDTLQYKMKCCGVLGPLDYLYSSWYNSSKDTEGLFVPSSCCAIVSNAMLNNNNDLDLPPFYSPQFATYIGGGGSDVRSSGVRGYGELSTTGNYSMISSLRRPPHPYEDYKSYRFKGSFMEDRHRSIASRNTQCQTEALLFKVNQDEDQNHLHTQGCQPVIMKWLELHFHKFTFIICSLIFVQLIDLILACVLVSWVRKKQADYWWCDEDEFT